jgi:hypothetical protein
MARALSMQSAVAGDLLRLFPLRRSNRIAIGREQPVLRRGMASFSSLTMMGHRSVLFRRTEVSSDLTLHREILLTAFPA